MKFTPTVHKICVQKGVNQAPIHDGLIWSGRSAFGRNIYAPLGYSRSKCIYGEMSELAEGARLEIACTTNSGTEGSNPSLSAIVKFLVIILCHMK